MSSRGFLLSFVSSVVLVSCGSEETLRPIADAGISIPNAPPARPGVYYVGVGGSRDPSGGQTLDQSWDLDYALRGADGVIQPGDTVFVTNGVYISAQLPSYKFRATVSGAENAPVTFLQYNTHPFFGPTWPIIDDPTVTTPSQFVVEGSYLVFSGFEFRNSYSANRTSRRPAVVYNAGSHNKFVNFIIHDGGVAFVTEPVTVGGPQVDVEITGSIIFNNGYQNGTGDRGHGHALYLKSPTGPVTASYNVLFNQYGYGIHAYADPGTGNLNNITMLKNVAFNNGTLAVDSASSNILLGGPTLASGDIIDSNMTYFSPEVAGVGMGNNVQIGARNGLVNGSVVVRDNYFVGKGKGNNNVIDFGSWNLTTVSNNKFIGCKPQNSCAGILVTTNQPIPSGGYTGYSWSGNLHHRGSATASWQYPFCMNGQCQLSTNPFSNWRTTTDIAATDQAPPTTTPPTSNVILYVPVPSQHKTTIRGFVVVYNWTNASSVQVNLSTIVPLNASYRIHNVQDLFNATPIVGPALYGGGSITLPIVAVTPPVPIGTQSSHAPTTGKGFNVFVVWSW